MAKPKKPRKAKSAEQETAPEMTPERQAQLEAEWALIERLRCRPKLERPARFKRRKGEPNTLDPDGDLDLNTAKLLRDFAVKDATFAARLVQQLGAVIPQREIENIAPATNASLAAVQEIAPRDGVEALLATQMVAVHNMAMEHLRRLAIDQLRIEVADSIANRATKLLRTFTAQVEALNRYRNAGKQNITVTHIGQVNAETAAIAVGCTAGVPGASPQNRGEPHINDRKAIENLANSSLASLQGYQQADKAAVPSTGDGEWSVLPPRRQELRRAQRQSA